MLVITRKKQKKHIPKEDAEYLTINVNGELVRIYVFEASRSTQIRLGIDAEKHVTVQRSERKDEVSGNRL